MFSTPTIPVSTKSLFRVWGGHNKAVEGFVMVYSKVWVWVPLKLYFCHIKDEMERAIKQEEGMLVRAMKIQHNAESTTKALVARREKMMAESKQCRDKFEWIRKNEEKMTPKDYLLSNPVKNGERNFNDMKYRRGMFLAAVSPVPPGERQEEPDDKITIKPNSQFSDRTWNRIPHLANKGKSDKVWCAASLVRAITFFFSDVSWSSQLQVFQPDVSN